MAIAVIGPDLAKNGFQIGSMSFGVVDRSIPNGGRLVHDAAR